MTNKLTDRITPANANEFTFEEMTDRAMKAENKVANLTEEMEIDRKRHEQFAADAFAHTKELKDEIARLKAELASLKA